MVRRILLTLAILLGLLGFGSPAAWAANCTGVLESSQVRYDNKGERFENNLYVWYDHCTTITNHYDNVTKVKLAWETLQGNKPNCDDGAIYGGIDHFEGNVGSLNGWNPGMVEWDCTTAWSNSVTYTDPNVPQINGSTNDRCVGATYKVVNDLANDKEVTLPTICVG